MDFVIIPHGVGVDYCTLWLGAFQAERRPERMELHVSSVGAPLPVPMQQWALIYPTDLLPGAGSNHYRQVVECRGLEADHAYMLHLKRGSDVLASASIRTLPLNLPSLQEEPFTVLLGSCFCQENDVQGDTGQSFRSLPAQDRPCLKILCGDQVYLDHPTVKNFPENSLELAEIFLNKYIRTWRESDSAGVQGLGSLLKHGANYFISDDHEFWNNYPNRATLIQNSWSEIGRMQWRGPARYLYRQFQSPYPEHAGEAQGFTVPPISFLMLDTRFFRGEGDTHFLSPSQMARLQNWIGELNAQRCDDCRCQALVATFSGHYAAVALGASAEAAPGRSAGCSGGSPWVGDPLTGSRRVPASISARVSFYQPLHAAEGDPTPGRRRFRCTVGTFSVEGGIRSLFWA